MAWTAQRTWTTGELVTATQFNTLIRDDLNASFVGVASQSGDIPYAIANNTITPLAIGQPYQIIATDSESNPGWSNSNFPANVNLTDTSVVNTSSETTLYTSSDIGNAILGLSDGLRLDFWMNYFNNSGAASNLTIKVKLDSTLLFTPINASSHGSSATQKRIFNCRYTLLNKNSAAVQNHFLETYNITGILPLYGVAGGGGGLIGLQACATVLNSATSTIDLRSGTHNIVITIQHSVANANISATTKLALLTLMRGT